MGENPVVAKAYLHMWEEPCISGTRGSGTVFFSGCNLKCIFCQNHEISHEGIGREITSKELADIFLSLRDKGAHNINLVTPSHFIPAILEALEMAKRKPAPLDIPIVYNTNGYDSIECLQMLEGSIDIYLPDLKYVGTETSMEYSKAKDYFEKASQAILEMYRQVGAPLFDKDGILQRGVIIRHLVLPGHTNDTLRVLDWIRESLPDDVYVSLMSQYIPCHLACSHKVIGRRLTRYEHEKVLNKFVKLGFNGFVQERDAASTQYIPDFKNDTF
jgi:putative pyruvate formate lyase activating enzyme